MATSILCYLKNVSTTNQSVHRGNEEANLLADVGDLTSGELPVMQVIC